MASSLNIYGDTFVPTTGTHGADIAVQRMDDLDIRAILFALQINGDRGSAIDLGCGAGIQGLRFATLGYPTTLIDWVPEEKTLINLPGLDATFPVKYLCRDARFLDLSDLPLQISICYSQRFIHYLRFSEAVNLFRLLRSRMSADGKLFVSASGIQSELAKDYSAANLRIEDRFAKLEQSMATKHGILESVCLYSENDLVTLGRLAGFNIETVFLSPFGNVKAVFNAID